MLNKIAQELKLLFNNKDNIEGSVYALFQKAVDVQSLEQANALVDYSQEKILSFHYDHLPVCWRRLLIDAGLVKAMIQLSTEIPLKSVLWDLDVCHVVSGSPLRYELTMKILNELQSHMTHSPRGLIPRRRQWQDLELNFPVERLEEQPSFEWFLMHTNRPMIFPSGRWPAHERWRSLDYLLDLGSDRMVPVEIGSSYTDASWRQEMMRLEDFVDRCLLGDEMGYLAQHDLLEQIPQLGKDILVPDYCYLHLELNEYYERRPHEVIKNAWLGPAGTVSPLHHDPFHNLLVQVAGSKYIRLYDPHQSVYPREGIMNNTSQVDIENPNLQEFPEFEKTQYVECILTEGDILYIPPKWWHFVKSLETSFNVSLWF
ncbi:hypothetical protein G6F56_011389 [Rhizopus delemar]|nr:hypothetical protein G6F56_011389 [Rhizopus delemar]